MIETRRTHDPDDYAEGEPERTPREQLRRDLAYTRENVRRELLRRGLGVLAASWPETVDARVDHSRWIADCARCSGAEFVDPEDPFFACLCCGYQANVRFPSGQMVARIEAALDARPHSANRNWRPGETAAALAAENREHGV